ncbi:helix-turn-helix domain-containing protein [Rathayibacter sp. YIM 133350]|uniref:helix-turn-helix domain-containing protein n=1 Tax=Rathayibacter sp. YIM 133350 TaxID=3131992 RepID=UPI00307D053D
MAVVLDSRTFPEGERSEAFRAGLDAALLPPTRLDMAQDAQGALHALDMGSGMTLQGIEIAGDRLRLARRSPDMLRESNPERVSVACLTTGICVTENSGLLLSRPDELRVLDLTVDYTITYHGSCRSISYEADCATLGLKVDAVRTAIPLVQASPLRNLMQRQLVGLADTADDLPPAARIAAGSSTAQLFRALLLSVAGEGHLRREAMAASLTARIDDYIRRNLHDPDLTPAQIAATHNISLRYLYVLFDDRAETPAEWIIGRRLEGARGDLAQENASIASLAQRWGFKDHSHFTRRFKAAYGLTPSQYADSLMAARDAHTTSP